MLQILGQTEGKVIATKAIGKLTKSDYEILIPILTNRLQDYKKIRWYFEMENFTGWELKAFWQDVKFDAQHADDFEKIAMVGEKKWQEWMADLMKPFTEAEVKFFDLKDRNVALEWIKDN